MSQSEQFRYHGYDLPALRSREKDVQRAQLEADVDAFLARGGQIRELPILVTQEERDAVAQPWTTSLGPLSRRRKQGEYTVAPGWEARPKKLAKRPICLIRGEERMTFESSAEAARHLGVSAAAVNIAVRRGRACAGWKAEYLTGEND